VDLLDLEKLGLLTKTRQGNKDIFRAPQDLADRLRNLEGQPEQVRPGLSAWSPSPDRHEHIPIKSLLIG